MLRCRPEDNPKTWYLADTLPKCPEKILCKTLLVASPQKKHYHEFQKAGAFTYYMPVWSWEEIDQCNQVLKKDNVSENYNLVGGIPRYVFEQAQLPNVKNSIANLNNVLSRPEIL